MARRINQRTTKAGGRPKEGPGSGEAFARPRKPDAQRILMAWLGAIVLAINLFGWTLVADPDTAFRSPAGSVVAVFADAVICDGSPDHPADHHGNHDRMVCPACFPLGNASAGALASVALSIPLPLTPITNRQAIPADAIFRSSFLPHRYQARAPPQPV